MMPHRRVLLIGLLLPFLFQATSIPARAWYPRLRAQGTVATLRPGLLIGADRPYLVGSNETLMEIAYRAGLGFTNLLRANPGLDPWILPVGRDLTLPFATLLPAAIAPGITINLGEFRLYLVQREGDLWRVRVYPIGLGRDGWATPEGHYRIVRKVDDPTWTPPASLRREKPYLPEDIPPGPDNPLGSHWLGLSAPGVGIHGTNQPFGVGRRVSHGCIRLYPRDIDDLAARVTVGTAVRIVYQPFKVAAVRGRLLVEIHPDYLERSKDPAKAVADAVARLGWPQPLNRAALAKALQEARGVPLPLPGATVAAERPLAGH